ncbi:hypothetical protein GCM10009651_31820 [Microbacterium natoriense]
MPGHGRQRRVSRAPDIRKIDRHPDAAADGIRISNHPPDTGRDLRRFERSKGAGPREGNAASPLRPRSGESTDIRMLGPTASGSRAIRRIPGGPSADPGHRGTGAPDRASGRGEPMPRMPAPQREPSGSVR